MCGSRTDGFVKNPIFRLRRIALSACGGLSLRSASGGYASLHEIVCFHKRNLVSFQNHRFQPSVYLPEALPFTLFYLVWVVKENQRS
jgi:hypothetical protein